MGVYCTTWNALKMRLYEVCDRLLNVVRDGKILKIYKQKAKQILLLDQCLTDQQLSDWQHTRITGLINYLTDQHLYN